MTRLWSYSVYIIFFFPVIPFCFVYALWQKTIPADNIFILMIVIMSLLCAWNFLFFLRSKRVYYDDGLLYVYDLLSAKNFTLTKDEVLRIKPVWYGRGTWAVYYYDENQNEKSVKFQRRWPSSDVRNIIGWYNDELA